MSAESFPQPPGFHEQLPSERLIAYLQGQFQDAVQKEASEDSRLHVTENGAFIQRVPTDSGHALLKGSRRILLKPPHPNDIPGFHCEIFAVRLNEESRSLPHKEYLEAVDFYVVRDYRKGRPGPYFLINSDGAHHASIEENGDSDLYFDGELIESDLFGTLKLAEQMLRKYSGYNIVAVDE